MSLNKQSLVDTSTTETAPTIWRKDIDSTFASAKQILTRAFGPPPKYAVTPSNDGPPKLTGLVEDLRKVGFKDVETLLSLFSSEIKGVQDDNKFLLEHLVQVLSKLDEKSSLGQKLTGHFVNTLWNGLPHPPQTSLSKKYRYREADGSHNNIRFPDIGKANTPYARAAKPSVLQNVALPDPGSIFDSLMVREKWEAHPNKISSMLFYLATIIIHDIFRTDHFDFNNSMTSSYLDLAPLYGSNQDEQDTVRTFRDGRLKPDCFSEKRILGFPPGVGVFLIMFNRFHNHVVTQLALINENGRFTRPKVGAEESQWKAYDNDLFQTGRLITCGLYVNCVLKDYVRTILSLNRTGTKWDLDPRTEEGKTLFTTPAAEATGNQCSAEFNLIYRWHSAISEKDDKWTQGIYAKMFPGRDPDEVTMGELLGALKASMAQIPQEPLDRNFADLKRQADGSFNDDELVAILESSISDVAGSFGANRVPKILRSVEILGIIQARSWNIATLNEFRLSSGLTKHTTFEDINPDKEVAVKLRNLYDHPDLVELYPGLVAEKAKPPISPGSGLCVNFTTSYAILADAVALVRGDRFYTIDWHAKSLTNWGFNEVQSDTSVDDGAVLYKLILQAFPNHFEGNSVYAHFPFVIPSENLTILRSLGHADKYSWDKPTKKPQLTAINSYAATKKIFEDKINWKPTWDEEVVRPTSQSKKTNGVSHSLSKEKTKTKTSREQLLKGLYPEAWHREIKTFYEVTTSQLIATKSFHVPGTKTRQVDIVRDVANLVNTRFAASIFSLPIKNEVHPHGVYTEYELYQVLTILFISNSMNRDLVRSSQIRDTAHTLAQQLGQIVLLNVESIAATGFIEHFLAKFHAPTNILTEYGTHVIQTLLSEDIPIKEIVWSHLLPTAASVTAYQSQIFTEALDYYLGEGAKYKQDLYDLSRQGTNDADEKILKYFMEGARLRSGGVAYRVYEPEHDHPTTTFDTSPSKPIKIEPNSRVILNLAEASRDPAAFSHPDEVDLTRPLSSYLHYGLGLHQSAGVDASMAALTAMFKAVFGLKGLRRATTSWGENPGNLKTVEGSEGQKYYMTPDQGSYFPVPTTMKIVWDEE